MLTNTLQRLIGLKSLKYVGVSILGIDTMSVSTMLGSKFIVLNVCCYHLPHIINYHIPICLEENWLKSIHS